MEADPPCQQCGKPIPGPHYPSRPRKFCGNTCKFAYQKKHPTRPRAERITQPCSNPVCENPVSFLPSQRSSSRGGGRRYKDRVYPYSDRVYCCLACKHAGQAIVMTGRRPSNGVYTSMSTFRNLSRRLFHDRCALCGWAEAPCDVAHIVAGSTDPEDVVMLCPNDHRLFDRGQIPVDLVRQARATILR